MNENVPSAQEVLASPATSFWLKRCLVEALTRDPVDASADATLLAEILTCRAAAALTSHKEK